MTPLLVRLGEQPARRRTEDRAKLYGPARGVQRAAARSIRTLPGFSTKYLEWLNTWCCT